MCAEKGLIVSCYLESMKGCEKEFIASVINLPQVVGLRVEGIDNIRFARQLCPREKFIIGLAKKWKKSYTLITPNESAVREIINTNADLVATNNQAVAWKMLETRKYGLSYPCKFVLDLNTNTFNELLLWNKQTLGVRPFISEHIVWLATTMEDRAYDLIEKMRSKFINAVIVAEGGFGKAEEIQEAFDSGANYVCIGKAINDPPTIVRRFMRNIRF